MPWFSYLLDLHAPTVAVVECRHIETVLVRLKRLVSAGMLSSSKAGEINAHAGMPTYAKRRKQDHGEPESDPSFHKHTVDHNRPSR